MSLGQCVKWERFSSCVAFFTKEGPTPIPLSSIDPTCWVLLHRVEEPSYSGGVLQGKGTFDPRDGVAASLVLESLGRIVPFGMIEIDPLAK